MCQALSDGAGIFLDHAQRLITKEDTEGYLAELGTILALACNMVIDQSSLIYQTKRAMLKSFDKFQKERSLD